MEEHGLPRQVTQPYRACIHCAPRPGVPVLAVSSAQSSPSTLFSRLESPCIPRTWATARLGCTATNNNISQPAHTEVQLKIHGELPVRGPNLTLSSVSPLSVDVSGPLEQLSAGSQYRLTCSSWGSSPPATLTWWLAGKLVGLVPQKVGTFVYFLFVIFTSYILFPELFAFIYSLFELCP